MNGNSFVLETYRAAIMNGHFVVGEVSYHPSRPYEERWRVQFFEGGSPTHFRTLTQAQEFALSYIAKLREGVTP
jgi:hypothetical protein